MRAQGWAQRISAARCICKARMQSLTCASMARGDQWNIGRSSRPVCLPAGAGFDDPGAFVAECHVFSGERVVIGDDDELAVELFGRFDLGRIEPGTTEVVGGE